jgi:hypothetical protein
MSFEVRSITENICLEGFDRIYKKSVSRGGQITFVLELERLLGIRYFGAYHLMVRHRP